MAIYTGNAYRIKIDKDRGQNVKRGSGAFLNNLKVIFLIVLMGLLFVYLFRFDFSRRIDYQVEEMTTDHLADISSQSVSALEKELDRVLEEVCYTAEFISQKQEITAEEERLLYSQLKEKCGFDNIRLISEDGKLYSADHDILPRSVGGYVEAIGRGESGMTDIFLSSITGEEVFGFYAPIRKDGKLSGGIAGIMIVDHIIDIIATTGFNSGSYNYVLKPDGSVVSQTSHVKSLYNGRNFLSFLRSKVKNGDKIAQVLQEHMKSGDSGVFFYQVGEEKRIAYYEPARRNDWYVVTAVSTEVTDDYIAHINKTAIYLTAKVAAIFLFVAILIIVWSHKTRKLILESKDEVELEKKKLELALRYSTNTIFEYKMKEDSLTFITPSTVKGKSFPMVLRNVSVNAAGQGLFAAEYAVHVLSAFKDVSKGKEQVLIEVAGGSAFEEETWFNLMISPVQDGKGDVVEAIGTMEDITEEKSIRRRFAQEEQYRAALLSESVAMWSVDLVKQKVIACTFVGKNIMEDRKNFLYSDHFIDRISRSVHPNDRERIIKMIQTSNMLAAYYMGTRELKELFRVIYPGVEDYKWVTCVISLLTEPTSGNPVAFACVRDVDEETRREMELQHTSERDPLTGLYNRRNIAEKINTALKKEGTLSCLMMMDLDGFKGINDQYGHQEGDLVLKKIAQILAGSFRTDDLVARLGGDEFLVFLTDLPNHEKACSRAEYVRSQVYDMIMENQRHDISISIGLSFAPMDGSDFTTLYQCADEALYCAKRMGKNQIKIYERP